MNCDHQNKSFILLLSFWWCNAERDRRNKITSPFYCIVENKPVGTLVYINAESRPSAVFFKEALKAALSNTSHIVSSYHDSWGSPENTRLRPMAEEYGVTVRISSTNKSWGYTTELKSCRWNGRPKWGTWLDESWLGNLFDALKSHIRRSLFSDSTHVLVWACTLHTLQTYMFLYASQVAITCANHWGLSRNPHMLLWDRHGSDSGSILDIKSERL